jgi:hypothetical protein
MKAGHLDNQILAGSKQILGEFAYFETKNSHNLGETTF